jgi:hypothetical protein
MMPKGISGALTSCSFKNLQSLSSQFLNVLESPSNFDRFNAISTAYADFKRLTNS